MDLERGLLTVLKDLQSIDPKEHAELLELVRQIGDLETFEAAKTDFLAFVRLMWPGFISGAHHKIMAKVVEDVVYGRESRVAVNLPPRFSKSEFFSYLMPAWFIGQNPSKKVIQICATADMAQGWSRKVRDLIRTEDYQRLFPGVRLKEDSKAAGRWHTSHGGEYFAVGAEGNVTGKGGDCLVGGSLVSTPNGPKRIEDILPGDSVIGFDHLLDKEVTSCVVATRRISVRDVCKIHTAGGHTLRCTPDHRLFVEGRGYITAGELGVGDRLLVGGARPGPEEDVSSSVLRSLQEGNPSSHVPGPQGNRTWYERFVLWLSLLKSTSCREVDHGQVSGLYDQSWSPQQILLCRVQEGGFIGKVQEALGAFLSRVWGDFLVKEEVLRIGLSKLVSCQENDRIGQFQFLASWPQTSLFCWPVPFDVGTGQGTRRPILYGLRDHGIWQRDSRWAVSDKSCGASPQRGEHRQQDGESVLSLRQLSYPSPSRSFVGVSSVEHYDIGEVYVYDIEVEGCRNFFAEGLLVHNCIIIDDPTGEQQGVAAIGNPAVYDKVYNWYVGGPRQRLQPNGRIAVVQSRWATNDFTGRLMRAERETDGEHRDKWKVIELPAILEGPDGVRKSLWPEFWPLPQLEATRLSLPPYRWNAQYMQKPGNDSSAILKKEWWRRWPTSSAPKCDIKIITMDTAFSSKEGADFTAATVWGVFQDEFVPNEDRDRNKSRVMSQLILLDAWKERLTFPELKVAAHKYYAHWQPDIFIVEAQATGTPLLQELRARGIPVSDYRPSRGTKDNPNTKIVRANSVSDILSSGMVWAPMMRWADDVIEECSQFPGGEHDDYVDAVVMALMRFRQGGFIRLHSDYEEEWRPRRRVAYY